MATENDLYEQDFGRDFPELRDVHADAFDDANPIQEANALDIELEIEREE